MNKSFLVRLLSLIILLVGFFLRVHDLGIKSFWLDEAYSWGIVAHTTWGDVWSAMLVVSDVSPLYYMLAKIITPMWGASEFSLRLFSVFFGWLSIAMTYRVGRIMFDERIAILTSLLIAISPFAVWYSQDARPYGLYLFLSIIIVWGLHRAQNGRGWTIFIVASSLIYLTHYIAILFAYTQALYIFTRLRVQPKLFRQWFLAQTLASLPVGAWVILFLLQKRPLTANSWIPTVTLLTPLQTVWNFFTGDATTWTLLMAIGIVLIIALIISGMRSTSPATLILNWYLFLPIGTAWFFSLWKPSYVDRYFEPSILPAMFFFANGLIKLPHPFRRYAVALAIVGILFSTSRIYTAPEFAKEDWRGAAKKIESLQLPVAVSEPESVLALSPYSSPQYVMTQSEHEIVDLSARSSFVFVVRSPLDSSHALTKSMPFEPLFASPLFFTQWIKANPSVSIQTHQFTGLALIEIRK